MARHRTLITYLAAYFFAIGAAVRYLNTFRGQPSFWTIAGLLAAFLLLIVIEPRLTRRSHRSTHLYLLVQTGIIIALSLTTPEADFFSLLFISLTLQAMHVFPPWLGFRWVGLYTVVMAVLMIGGPGWETGLRIPMKSSTSSGDAVHMSERSDASVSIILSSGRQGQGRINLAP